MGDNNVGQGRRIRSVLVANRSEIAIRVMRAATELGLRTIGIYSHEDRFALHRTKADESYLVGQGQKPLQAYLDIAEVIRVAKQAGADAIHPGYGFLSENPELPRACAAAGIAFIGPTAEVMTRLGNKVAAREAAPDETVPVGTELQISHLHPAQRGWVTAVATPVHHGKRTAVYEVRISDEDGRAVARGTLRSLYITAQEN